MTDEERQSRELEARIKAARIELLDAETPTERRVKWRAMRELILQRTPEQVERMEVAKGLRPAAPA